MCVEMISKKKKPKLIRTEDLNQKIICQLVFEICFLREEQLRKFKRINCRLEEKQKKFDFGRIKQRISRIDFKKIRKREKFEKVRNRRELFEKVKKILEGRQKREKEKKFKEIRKKLGKRGRFKELEIEIERRRQELGRRSECTFPVLCQYIHLYKESQ